MSVSKEEVKHLAKLSKLKFSDVELEKFTSDISNIVEFANQLDKINVDEVKPTAHILDLKNVLRKDEIKPSFNREEMLKNAPSKDAGCISVPKVME